MKQSLHHVFTLLSTVLTLNSRQKVDRHIAESRSFLKSHPHAELTIFLHGIFQTYHSAFVQVVPWFKQQGMRIIPVGYDYGQSVPVAAMDVAKKIRTLMKQTGRKKINVVGFSYGGVVARYYAEKLGGKKVMAKFVTVGVPCRVLTPRTGTGYFIEKYYFKDRFESTQRILRELEDKSSVKKHISVYGSRDKIFNNKTATIKKIRNIAVPCGHMTQMYHLNVWNIIADYLQKR